MSRKKAEDLNSESENSEETEDSGGDDDADSTGDSDGDAESDDTQDHGNVKSQDVESDGDSDAGEHDQQDNQEEDDAGDAEEGHSDAASVNSSDISSSSEKSLTAENLPASVHMEDSTLVESRPASVGSNPDIIIREATADLTPSSPRTNMPSNITAAHYHREALRSESSMTEEDSLPDSLPEGFTRKGSRRSSLFEVPHGLWKPAVTGSSVTSALVPEEVIKVQRKVQFENTYHLEPPKKFRSDKARVIIEDVLEHFLDEKQYDPVSCSVMSKQMATQIKDRVKQLGYERYKIIAVANIGQKKEQGIRVCSRAVWDADRDTSASVTYENQHLFAVASVFAIYYE